MNRSVTIVKNSVSGGEVWRYPGEEVARSKKGIIAEAFFNRADLEFNGIVLKKDDRFLELYLFEKWFNIYQIYDRDDKRLKAWYCNITRPVRVMNGFLYYDDLALDLLVYPDGRQLALDRDEFLLLDLSPSESSRAESALKELIELFKTDYPLDIYNLL